MHESPKKQVLFVCTGNTCRSVMAEGILRKISDEFIVRSAGTAANPEYTIFGGLAEILGEEAIDFSDHVSTPVTEKLLNDSFVVLVMEEHHRELINRCFPSYSDRVFLLAEYSGSGGGISDPIGLPKEEYRKTFDKIASLIKNAVPRLNQKKNKGE